MAASGGHRLTAGLRGSEKAMTAKDQGSSELDTLRTRLSPAERRRRRRRALWLRERLALVPGYQEEGERRGEKFWDDLSASVFYGQRPPLEDRSRAKDASAKKP